MIRQRSTGIAAACHFLIISLMPLFWAPQAAAENGAPRIHVSLKPGKNVGVGYNLLPLDTTALEVWLSAPDGYTITESQDVDPEGELAWNLLEQAPGHHLWRAEGLTVEDANGNHAVRFDGKFSRKPTAIAGQGKEGQPEFKASVADLDIDVDSTKDHRDAHWSPRPENDTSEDNREATINGGLVLPPLHAGNFPAQLPDGADYKILRLTHARVKWGGHPDGTAVTPDRVGDVTFLVSGNGLALYRLDGTKARMPSGTKISVPTGGLSNVEYGILSNEHFTSPGSITAIFSWDPGLQGSTGYSRAVDWVRIRPAEYVSITIDDVPDSQKVTPGGVVVRRAADNNAPRKKIWLDTSADEGNLVLTRTQTNPTELQVFDKDGVQVAFNGNDNKFPAEESPWELFVQGHEASSQTGDVTLKLTHEADPDDSDSVKFTVLWVTVSAVHGGKISADNAGKAFMEALSTPPTDSLGPVRHLLTEGLGTYGEGARLSRLSEFIGTVQPNDFDPKNFLAQTSLFRMNRDLLGGKGWGGASGTDLLIDEKARPDTSPYARDEDPQSGGSGGKIYDLDAPGVNPLLALNTLPLKLRLRSNFSQFAQFSDGGDWIRCSSHVPWCTKQSYKTDPTKAPHKGEVDAVGDNTLTGRYAEWTPDEWKDCFVEAVDGNGNKHVRRVTGNTGNTLTVAPGWSALRPQRGSVFHLLPTSLWIEDAEFNGRGDNQNADGATPLTPDLN